MIGVRRIDDGALTVEADHRTPDACVVIGQGQSFNAATRSRGALNTLDSPAVPPRSAAHKLETPAAERGQLTPERILTAAIKLMDREGIEALTMRRLGAQLGVEAMSLYRYFASKDVLLAAASTALAEQIREPVEEADPIDGLRQVMTSFYDVAERHPSLVDLLFRGPSVPAFQKRRATDHGTLTSAGFTDEAPLALECAVAYVVGALAQRRTGPRKQRERAFQFGLEMLLSGLQSEASRRSAEAAANVI